MLVVECKEEKTEYSWSSNFAVNVLEDDPAKIESANFILLVKLGSRAAIGYYPLRERGAANIRIREYQYREYRGPTVPILRTHRL